MLFETSVQPSNLKFKVYISFSIRASSKPIEDYFDNDQGYLFQNCMKKGKYWLAGQSGWSNLGVCPGGNLGVQGSWGSSPETNFSPGIRGLNNE